MFVNKILDLVFFSLRSNFDGCVNFFLVLFECSRGSMDRVLVGVTRFSNYVFFVDHFGQDWNFMFTVPSSDLKLDFVLVKLFSR